MEDYMKYDGRFPEPAYITGDSLAELTADRDCLATENAELRAHILLSGDCDYLRTLKAENEKLQAALAAIGEPRICLNCGASEPCELKDDLTSPCTFDPDYATGVRMWKHERRKMQKILTLLAPTNVICMPGYPRVISESTLNSIQSHREILHRKALEISNEPLDEKPED